MAGTAHALVTMDQLLQKVGGELEWDANRAEGTIRAGNNAVMFGMSSSVATLNYQYLFPVGSIGRTDDGTITFSDDGASKVEVALTNPSVITGVTAHPDVTAIIIDPGHGGKDPGTIQDALSARASGLKEKDIVLKVGLDLDALLKKKYPDKTIVMTRGDDSFVSLEKRTEVANAIDVSPPNAKVFVSIHANAAFDKNANGYEVWYLPPTYERDVLDPSSLDKSSKGIYPILNAMQQEEYTIQSTLLGKSILSGLDDTLGSSESDRGLKANDWYVVRNSDMPAVLVEVGFVSNKSDAAHLGDDAYLEKIAEGILQGIVDFVDHFEKPKQVNQ